jgi:HlyD family secretion protein
MNRKIIFILSFIGVMVALYSAYLFSLPHRAEKPVFQPASNPFDHGIYAQGIIESAQQSGENMNLYFEVPGSVSHIDVHEGDEVKKGTPLASLDDSIQRPIVEQQQAQAAAALTLLKELQAQPRPETLAVSKAQLESAEASVKLTQAQYDKLKQSQGIQPGSVSKDALDNALNALNVAIANAALARKQYDLTKAGAWSYDIENQEKQYQALSRLANSSMATLSKYTLKAPEDGVVLAVNITSGSFVSTQGTYETYTEGMTPAIVMGRPHQTLAVRCYIDEILVHRLPVRSMRAEMSVRGTSQRIPLEFVRVQPFVSPKIELSNQRAERVDVRVLPVIFQFKSTPDAKLYPGQMVDVYIAQDQ